MPRAYRRMTLGRDDSTSDFVAQLMTTMEEMPKEMFNARPLPQNPTVLTLANDLSLRNDTELWDATCPVCRPLVRDMNIFCKPQPATFQDQNVFICWNVVFSELASVLMTKQPLGLRSATAENCDEQNEKEGIGEKEKFVKSDMASEKSGSSRNRSNSTDLEQDTKKEVQSKGVEFCLFCAYYACLIFDDSMYTLTVSTIGIDDFELDCCCMESMTDSVRIKSVAEKLLGYAEKFGQDAEIEFIIQPIDYDIKHQHFSRLRFQAYSRSPAISDEDLRNILGMRRELVLELYGIPGRISGDLPLIEHWPIVADPEQWPKAGKAWLSQCLSNHESCLPPVKGPLPSRVVEILDDENLRIVSGAESLDSFYITLSYVWGVPQEFALTENTIADRKRGFKIASLPPTLRDAISVTKEHEIKYIWIDSLCIIQDSAEDKHRELPRMADYYRNSYLTISASTGNCKLPFLTSDGLCTKHPEAGIPKDLVPLGLLISPVFEVMSQEDGGDHSVGTKFTQNMIEYLLVRKESPYLLSMESIYRRGWTFQERILSPRNLLFGGRVVWQCHTSQESAGGVTWWDEDAPNIDHLSLGRVLYNSQHRISAKTGLIEGTPHARDQYSIWYKAVEEYTRRELSFSGDKLPAISALAQVFQDLTGDEYLAGIWRADFLRGLMRSTYPTLSLSRPSLWRAPSWSWASHDNEVSYKGIPPPDSIPIAQVLASKTFPLSAITPLGEIESATLEIEGPVLELDKEVTIFLMQKENELSKLEDTPKYRFDIMLGLLSRNREVGAGCESWEPPDGHIFLVLLAIPSKVRSIATPDSTLLSDTSEANASNDNAKNLPKTTPDENAVHAEEFAAKIGVDPKIEGTTGSNISSSVREIQGYSLSGLVLGPATVDMDPEKPKYERLARFTSIGGIIEDYKDLEKLRRSITLV